METTAVAAEKHEPVAFGGAFVRQFRLLWWSRRPVLLMVALLAVLMLAGEPWVDESMTRLLLVTPVWLVFVGPIWAFAVFHNEGPANRYYHWSLPVGRTTHTLARLAAGAAWLWLLLALLVLIGVLVGAADGDAWQFREIALAGWFNLFTGPLIGYLGVSLLTIASDYPIRWFFALLLLVPLTLEAIADWLGLEALARTLVTPLESPVWGLGTVLIGALGTEVAALHAAIDDVEPSIFIRNFELANWWAFTPVWILLIAGLVVALASRHPDSLPRLRRG
jgi:hypothetical protein